MKSCMHHKEYSARYGLKQALNNLDKAQQIAEIKYRTLVGREILFSEIYDIHHLIDEMRSLDELSRWPLKTSSVTGSCLSA